jgi:ADP-ribosylglycohydrolase
VTTYSKQQSDVTHPYARNGLCCALYSHLIVSAIKAKSKAELAAMIPTSELMSQDRKLEARFSQYSDLSVWQAKHEDEIKSSGYVLDTLEAALWAFFTTNNFHDGAIRVVNLGDSYSTTVSTLRLTALSLRR